MPVPHYVNLHCIQVGKTEVLLSSDEGSFTDNGLLWILFHSFKEVEDLVFLEKVVDEGSIVYVVHSSQSLHVSQDVDLDYVSKVERNFVHQVEEHKFVRSNTKSFEPTLCLKLFWVMLD